MDIRAAHADDIRDLAELWCDAFPANRTVADRMRMLETGGRYGGLETVLVARAADGGLAGACKAYRMEQVVTGVVFPMMGLAAVAVEPAARRRGLGARLCTESMRQARERGDVLSTLFPFRPDYYERLGWGLAGELHEYRIRTACLPGDDLAGYVRAARFPADTAAIAACYESVARASTGPILRDDRVWAYRLTGQELGVRPVPDDVLAAGPADPRLRVLVHDREGVDGYALLRYSAGRAPDRATLVVRELVSATEAAYRGLLAYLAGLAGQWPRTLHFARPAERFGDRLRDPRPPGFRAARSLSFPTARLVRGPMLRVLDAERALGMRTWFEAGGRRSGVAFRIEVRDDQLPENRGPWTVRVEDGGADRAAVHVARGEAAADAGITLDAATFARVFAGDLAPTDAARIGRAELAGEAALLDRAFATRDRFWLLDEF